MSSSRTTDPTTAGYSAREREIVAALTALPAQTAHAGVDDEARSRAKDRILLALAADRAIPAHDADRGAGRIAS